MSRGIEWLHSWFGLPPSRFRRLAHFLFLAVSLVTVNVLGMTLAESLFLSYAGPEHMPLFYVLLAIVSIPVAAAFSRLVDRLPRLRLFRYLLLAAILTIIGLRLLVTLQTVPVYYAIFIGLTIIELLIDIQFWLLVSDYFTSLDLKHHAPFLVMAMAAGGLLGGALARILSDHLATRDLLAFLPFLFAVAIAQLYFLQRSQVELQSSRPEEAEVGLGESLRVFPTLIRRYPIIALIAANGLLVVIVQHVIEFQVFTVYSNTFPTPQNLTRFLGVLNAALSVLEFGITYFFTRPLIQRLGVSRMNLIYPMAALASLTGLGISFRLPAALAANISYDTLAQSVAQPIEALNYNAVPGRFRGRVRVISDGFFYPGGLALAGGLLLVSQEFLGPSQVSFVGVVLCGALLVVGYLVGRGYPASLLQGLRSRSVNLDEVREGISALPVEYVNQVRELLTSEDRASQILGLELASRMEPDQFLDPAQELLSKADSTTLRSLVKFYCAFRPQQIVPHLRALLNSPTEMQRALALETMIARGEPLSTDDLLTLLGDSSLRVRVLATVAAYQADEGNGSPEVMQTVENVLESELDSDARLAAIRAVGSTSQRNLLPLLWKIQEGGEAMVKREALEAVASMTKPADAQATDLVAGEIAHEDPRVRAGVYKVLGLARDPRLLAQVAAGMADDSQIVRERAATAVAAYGEQGLSLAETYLHSPRAEVVDAAIVAIGLVGTRRAERILLDFMSQSYRQVGDNLRWMAEIPNEPAWGPLSTALHDNNERTVNRALHVLSSLGNARTLDQIRCLLHSQDERLRADAVEALASFGRREFVEPILPLLEHHARGGPWLPHKSAPRHRANGHYVLYEALQAADRWIRVAALAVMSRIRSPLPGLVLAEDPDPMVKAALLHMMVVRAYLHLAGTAAESGSSQPVPTEDLAFMNRVLFLKNISLFQYLTLDQLLVVDDILEQKEYLAGEVIFAQESLGSNFYIIYRGSVAIRRQSQQGEEELAVLSPREFFGEMALFDDSPRSATAVAVNDCTLLSLDRSHFHSLIVQRPEISMEICKVLSLRLRKANERLGWWRWRKSWGAEKNK